MFKRLLCVLVLFFLSTVEAQPAVPKLYPTITALEQSVIPPRDRVELARKLLGITDIPAPPDVPATYTLGQRRTFRALNTSANRIFEVEAELKAIGEHIYIWVDTSADVDNEAAQSLADAFDSKIYPEVRDLWGSEATPGIDSDPRVFGLFTYGLGSGVAAYFSSENTYPNIVAPSSNEHEMFIYELSAVGTDIANWSVQSTTAHEFQHMIRANVNQNADTWLNEGLSVFTQLYLGYPDGAWSSWAYQAAPYTQLNTWAESGSTAPHYGGALLWVTYFYERYGLKALQTVSRDPAAALLAFDNVLADYGKQDVNELFADWVLANWWRDTSLAEGQYGYELIPGLAEPYSDFIIRYPVEIEDEANQYSTDYFVLEELPASGTLTIEFEAPETVRLVPTDAASGSWMWYSNRRDNSATTLTRAFDLSGMTSATLAYDVWYILENRWDYGYVMVSANSGVTWELLTTPAMTDANPHGTAYGDGYTGSSGNWLRESLSLDDYVGQEILVRFAVITDDATNQHGMVVDNVAVDAVGYFSDFETDDGGWQPEGWALIDNVLPQQVWIQVAQQSGDAFEVTRWLHPDDQTMTTPLLENAEKIMLAVSPFAPQTTVSMPYTLRVGVE